MSARETAENDAATEYRVMWWSAKREQWFPHAGHTVNPKIAEAWLQQARYHEWPTGTEAVMEARQVGPWTRVTPPAGGRDE